MGMFILNDVYALHDEWGDFLEFPLCRHCYHDFLDGQYKTYDIPGAVFACRITLVEHNRAEFCDCGRPVVSSPVMETESSIAGYGNAWIVADDNE